VSQAIGRIALAAPRRTMALRWHRLLILPALLLVVLFLGVPYLNIVVMSFRTPATTAPYAPGFTIVSYVKALSDPLYLVILWRTLRISVVVTALCLLIAYPVSYHMARTRSRFRGLLFAGILSPLLVGVVIRCYGWIILLANNGLVNVTLRQWGLISRPLPMLYNEFGVTLGMVHIYLPFMILPLLSAIQGINPSLEEAARSLGASRIWVMRHVVWPLSAPGVQSGTVLVFVLSVSSYVTPVVLGGSRVKMMAPIVVQQLDEAFLWPFGTALAIVLAVTGGLSVAAWFRITQRLFKGVL
jgi:putative spermidine/putrescine transport system permease protein